MNGDKFDVSRKVLRTFSLHHEDHSAATGSATSSRQITSAKITGQSAREISRVLKNSQRI
jgi:hypothetical protein